MRHIPVLLNEVISVSKKIPQGWFVDCTLGRAGHFIALLNTNHKVVGFDADKDAVANASSQLELLGYKLKNSKVECKHYINSQLNSEAILCEANFSHAKQKLLDLGIDSISFILADLGLSMEQLLRSGRGFSFSKPDELLDMRIDTNSGGPRALDLLNFLSQNEITVLLRDYGDIHSAKNMAKKIVFYREHLKKIETVGDLLKAVEFEKKIQGVRVHPATKLFMALRIAVNSEFQNLKTLLDSFSGDIKNGTVMNIISFHSLEQKMIENFALTNTLKISKIRPSFAELEKNPSSRSATLNILTK